MSTIDASELALSAPLGQMLLAIALICCALLRSTGKFTDVATCSRPSAPLSVHSSLDRTDVSALSLCDNESLFLSIWELFALQTQLSASLKASKCLWVPNYPRAYRKPLKCERNLQNYLKIEDFVKSSWYCTTLDLRSLGASCTQESCQTAPRNSQ